MALRYFAGRAAGAAAGVAAGSSSVQARAPVQAAPQVLEQRNGKSLDDDWLVLQPQHGDIVLMKPFETFDVDEAIADVAKHMQTHSRGGRAVMRPVASHEVSELSVNGAHSGTSTPTSQGSAADSQITGTFLTGSAMHASGVWPGDEADGRPAGPGIDITTLLGLTSRMLKRPGMQVELVKAMMEDPEIQEILLREGNDLDNYLLAAGALPVHSLLPPAAVAALEGEEVAQGEGAQGEALTEEMNVLANLVNGVVSALEHAGTHVHRLVGWLRCRVALLLGLPAVATHAPDAAQAEAEGAAGAGKAPPNKGDRARVVLQSVLAVAAIVVVVMIFKRPVNFRRAPSFFRR